MPPCTAVWPLIQRSPPMDAARSIRVINPDRRLHLGCQSADSTVHEPLLPLLFVFPAVLPRLLLLTASAHQLLHYCCYAWILFQVRLT